MNTETPFAACYAACPDYSDKALQEAVEKILAPQLEVRGPLHGKSVMLKPNLLAWRKKEDPACVHPRFLVACAKAFLDAGAAKVAVMENPAIQSVPAILHSMEIDRELDKLGVAYKNFSAYRPMNPPEGVRFHDLEIASEYREFDFTADLAKTKTHAMMTLTLCVKNLFGFVNGSARLGWHLSVGRDFDQFADMLLDLYLTIRPDFNLIDGIVSMEGNGPGSGTPVHTGFLAGGADALALDDSVAKTLGVENLLIIRRAKERGFLPEFVNTGDTVKVTPLVLPDPPSSSLEWGVTLPKFCRGFLRDHLLSRPVLVSPSKCIGCGLCAKMCPPGSLKMADGRPRFDYPECIRCCCCQEHCPQGAIEMKKSVSMRVLETVEKTARFLLRKA